MAVIITITMLKKSLIPSTTPMISGSLNCWSNVLLNGKDGTTVAASVVAIVSVVIIPGPRVVGWAGGRVESTRRVGVAAVVAIAGIGMGTGKGVYGPGVLPSGVYGPDVLPSAVLEVVRLCFSGVDHLMVFSVVELVVAEDVLLSLQSANITVVFVHGTVRQSKNTHCCRISRYLSFGSVLT